MHNPNENSDPEKYQRDPDLPDWGWQLEWYERGWFGRFSTYDPQQTIIFRVAVSKFNFNVYKKEYFFILYIWKKMLFCMIWFFCLKKSIW